MLETALVIVAVVAAGLTALVVPMFTSGLVTVLGLSTLLLGLTVGMCTGLCYHVILYRLVSAKAPVSRTWWLYPSVLHRQLSDAERQRIRPWYRLGGIGFTLCVAGGLAAIVGVLMAPR
jgi:hypothetical protein